jgi:hypothetical protein
MAGNPNYPTDLLTTTWEIFLSTQPSDAVFGDLVLFDVLSKKSKVSKRGGIKILQPLMYAKSTAVGSYSGWDVLDLSPQEGLTNAEFDWKFYYGSLAISNEELFRNSGKAQMIDLLESKWAQAKMSLADKINKDMFLDGTGNGGKDITGLALMADSAGTYGGINRSTNTWWGAQETNVGGVLAITGSTGMRRMYNDCSLGRGRVTPDFIITTQAGFESYEALLDANMRYTITQAKTPVFQNLNLMFRDTPLFWDDYCQTGTMYFLNSNFIKLVVFSERDGGVNKGDDRDTGDFRTEPFQTPQNQDGKVAKFFWQGQLVASNCRHLGKLTGISNA